MMNVHTHTHNQKPLEKQNHSASSRKNRQPNNTILYVDRYCYKANTYLSNSVHTLIQRRAVKPAISLRQRSSLIGRILHLA